MSQSVDTITCQPKWIDLLPVLVELTKNKKPEPQQIAWSELKKMANAADQFVDLLAEDSDEPDNAQINAASTRLLNWINTQCPESEQDQLSAAIQRIRLLALNNGVH